MAKQISLSLYKLTLLKKIPSGNQKTKVLISFAVTAKLVCAFVFALAFCWFSYAVAHFTMLYRLIFYGKADLSFVI